jgi:glucose-6-phosphate isomerase
MKTMINLNYGDSLIGQNLINEIIIQLKPEMEHIKGELHNNYNSAYGFINLAFDEKLNRSVTELSQKKRNLNPTTLFIIGIGGSSLGIKAVHEALAGIFYNEVSVSHCYFVDTIADSYTQQLLIILEKILLQGEMVLIIVISKSGTTTETLTNAAFFLELMIKYRPHSLHDSIICITDENSPLLHRAQQHNFSIIALPAAIGGRFSVFSPVGLFPLSLLGYDINAICRGAQKVFENFPSNDYAQQAAQMAALIFINYQKGKNILDTFVFNPSLESLGAWYRQLVGESLGKNGKGMTPTVSVGTQDLHSVTQLYLGGPEDKFTIFIHNEAQETLLIPTNLFSKDYTPTISVARLHNAIFQGVQAAYKAKERSFVSWDLNILTEERLGLFLSMRMLEIVYVGFLLGINPFNQPEVELYKEQTRKVLNHE